MLSLLPPRSRSRNIVAALAIFLGAPLALHAAPQYGAARPASFARAERLREALEGRPEQQRTRLQYERVLDAYRAIYHGDPASPRADASIAAVADLLAEEGRVFQDDKALHDAIGQYEFLRTQYPGSRFRFSALLTEGEISQHDLDDLAQARADYQKFLRLYPNNPLAGEARAELHDMRREQIASRHEEGRADARTPSRDQARSQIPDRARRDTIYTTGTQQSPPRRPDETPSRPQPRTTSAQIEESNIPPSAGESRRPAPTFAAPTAPRANPTPAPAALDLAPPPPRRGTLPLITGIRYWSTPVYTRVAIDLQQEVRYEAVRVPNPDRIYFDLYGARLSPELMGRSDQVTDEGFLTRIRAAQYSEGVSRIVLDVTSLSDYSAFFLPNPPRLIIDIHGRKGAPPATEIASAPRAETQPRVTRTGRPAAPPQISEATPRSVHPSTVADANSPSALAEVDTISSQPDQVRATRYPTTAPVVASVAGTTPAAQPKTWRRPSTHTAAASAPRPADQVSADQVPPARAGSVGVPAAETLPAENGVPTSMVRALGLKINRIVIDPGHGGHDSGTLGPGGIEEKNVVLDVALRLGRLLHQRLGSDVIFTRTDDTFIPLETRTAIANQAQADLFISIHANSSSDPDTRGVEVYYLNFTTSADALEVAARENAVSDESIHQLSDLVKKIALQDKINESRAFAADVDQALYDGLEQGNPGLKDRGVKKAPFVVLIGANMPSILAEISFLTNPDSAAELRTPAYRERIAEALYRGVAQYVSSLQGVRVAQAGIHPAPSE